MKLPVLLLQYAIYVTSYDVPFTWNVALTESVYCDKNQDTVLLMARTHYLQTPPVPNPPFL